RPANPIAHHGQATSETKSIRRRAGVFMAIQSVCVPPDVEAIARMSMKYCRSSTAEIHRNAHAALPRIRMARHAMPRADVELHARCGGQARARAGEAAVTRAAMQAAASRAVAASHFCRASKCFSAQVPGCEVIESPAGSR